MEKHGKPLKRWTNTSPAIPVITKIKLKSQTSIVATAGNHKRIFKKANVEREESPWKDNVTIESILGLSHGLVVLNKVKAGKLTCSNYGPRMAMSIESVAIYHTDMFRMVLKPT